MKKLILTAILSCILFGDIFSQVLPFTYTYTGKPRFQILTKRNNAVLGIINVELFPKIAPRHTRNFDSLVSQIFYDTTAFHRVIPGFMIQGGDPNSRSGPKPTWGYGQPGQPKVQAEFSVAKHRRGILSAARSTDINSATSQFFICHANPFHLDGNYSVYGRVTSGINFVDTIANAPKDVNNNPNDKIEMFITYIGSNDTVPNPPTLVYPKNDSLEVDTNNVTNLTWLPQSDGIIYHLDVSTDQNFTTITHSLNTSNLNYMLSAGLPGGTNYYWRLNTNNGGHISTFSPVRRFKTQMPYVEDVGINEHKKMDNKITVFPNPSTGMFTISNIETGSKVEVFDLTGKLILKFTAKQNTAVIDLEGKEKGLYNFKITNANQEIGTGKLLVK